MRDGTHKRGIRIYRAADSEDLIDTDFMRLSKPPARLTSASPATLKLLTREPDGFSLVHCWFKENYPLGRHTHDVDCMYYVISGSAIMGSQTLFPGDSFFVPAGSPYKYTSGPEGVEVLEIRHGVDQFDVQPQNDAGHAEKRDAAVATNQESWARQSKSPTFAANPNVLA